MTQPTSPRIAIVTGADAKFLPMAGALRQSLGDAGWRGDVRICDFGLTDRQAGILREAGILLSRPARLAPGIHPFFCKAALVDYVAALDFDVLVWIDSDMIALDDVAPALGDLAAQLAAQGRKAALSADAGVASIAEACARLDMRPFQDALARAGIGADRPYLNTGLVAIADRGVLAAWRDLAFSIPAHALFEQNAFNLLVHDGRCPAMLVPAARWNVHGPLLAAATHGAEGGVVVGDQRAVLVHATSAQASQHEIHDGAVRLTGGVFDAQLKLFRNPVLRIRQVAALNRWSLDPVAQACAVQPRRHGAA